MLSGPLASGTRTYYLITCLHVLIQSIYNSALNTTCCCTAVICMLSSCHSLVVIRVISHGALSYVVATLGQVTTIQLSELPMYEAYTMFRFLTYCYNSFRLQ